MSDPIEKIAVFRALQLGDMLNVVPAVRALRMAFPDAEIVLLGLPWAAGFVRRFDCYFDRWMHFPGFPGLPEQEYDATAFAKFLQKVRGEEFDLLLQMQGDGTIVNDLLAGFGARLLAGFHTAESRMESAFFVEYPALEHEIRRHLALMAHLGIPRAGEDLEFPLTAADEEELGRLGLPLEPGKYVCIHPGSRGVWRQWPPDHFALVADICGERGLDIVVTGTADERDISREVIGHLRHPAIDVTGLTSVGAMGVLLRGASLLVSNCTGVAHMASALRTPSVVISMDGEPFRWGALNKRLHRTIDWTAGPGIGMVVAEVEELVCGAHAN
ncbi:MAG: glycosyltransferase family 9 protein [Bacteroidetes bacterium]|nr:glycosyltransferase family 9 protein [Bacteroidota bacterium]